MSREWKPGDVAMVTWTDDYDGAVQRTVRMLIKNGTTDAPVGQRRDAWWGPDGYLEATAKGLAITPLVVIDPEDREAVERLISAIPFTVLRTDIVGVVQAALREFANPEPPKPEEPSGLGARVTDRGGLEWAARTGLHPAPDGMGLIERRWGCLNGSANDRTWDDLCDERGPLEVQP